MQYLEEAKQAFETWRHRAGKDCHTPFEHLPVREQEAWGEVVKDIVEDYEDMNIPEMDS